MSLFSTARSIYVALCDDENALAAISDARTALARAIATESGGGTVVTSATVNGQTFTALQTLRPLDRLQVLTMVCQMAEAGTPFSNTVKPLL